MLATARKHGIKIEVKAIDVKRGGHQVDALVRIGAGRNSRTYAAEIRKSLRPATLGAALHQMELLGQPALLIADYVTPPMAETLKACGVDFLDAAGNAYIGQPPILIWVKGERPTEKPTAERETGRAFRRSGLKVVLGLLCNPEWACLPYREIGERVEVAHGTVGEVLPDLKKLGFLAKVDGKRRLLQPERLLRQWAEAYARTLRPTLMIGRYRTDLKRWEELIPDAYGVCLGAEPAAQKLTGHLRPEIITLYSDKLDNRLLLDYELRLDPHGPVELIKRVWAFETNGRQVVPMPLIYADLLSSGDARCLETAKLIYERIVDGVFREG